MDCPSCKLVGKDVPMVEGTVTNQPGLVIYECPNDRSHWEVYKVLNKDACPKCGENRAECLAHYQYSIFCLTCHHTYIL